ncbi:MAG: MFS transporter [Candidatus Curtissbacteria bacterium]|nr:MFS transporter [bacterium]MDZ4209856.1 MFS transporter [Candidatus Curtissbacteria bacterium]
MLKNNPILVVLRLPDFAKIWASQILSQVTINLINFVIVIRIFENTHSTLAVSLVWIFYAIPALFLGPFSGTIVDLTEKRKILVLTTLVEAFVVLMYLLTTSNIWPIYGIIFLYSLVNQLYIPAEASTLTGVVPRALLPAANTLFMLTIYGSFILGFGGAGLVVRALGAKMPFLLASFFLLAASFSVYLLPKNLIAKREKINGLSEFWTRVLDGYQFIRERTEILYPLALLVAANAIISVLAVIAPLFATEIININLLDVGLAIVFPIGLGALFGSLLVVQALKYLRKKWVITFGLSDLACGLLFFSLVLPNMHLSQFRFILALFVMFIMGIGLVSLFIPAQTLLQEKTPEEFRGRVFGLLGFLFTLVSLLPIIFTAAIADIIGAAWVLFVLGALLVASAIYSLREPYLKKEVYAA